MAAPGSGSRSPSVSLPSAFPDRRFLLPHFRVWGNWLGLSLPSCGEFTEPLAVVGCVPLDCWCAKQLFDDRL